MENGGETIKNMVGQGLWHTLWRYVTYLCHGTIRDCLPPFEGHNNPPSYLRKRVGDIASVARACGCQIYLFIELWLWPSRNLRDHRQTERRQLGGLVLGLNLLNLCIYLISYFIPAVFGIPSQARRLHPIVRYIFWSRKCIPEYCTWCTVYLFCGPSAVVIIHKDRNAPLASGFPGPTGIVFSNM